MNAYIDENLPLLLYLVSKRYNTSLTTIMRRRAKIVLNIGIGIKLQMRKSHYEQNNTAKQRKF